MFSSWHCYGANAVPCTYSMLSSSNIENPHTTKLKPLPFQQILHWTRVKNKSRIFTVSYVWEYKLWVKTNPNPLPPCHFVQRMEHAASCVSESRSHCGGWGYSQETTVYKQQKYKITHYDVLAPLLGKWQCPDKELLHILSLARNKDFNHHPFVLLSDFSSGLSPLSFLKAIVYFPSKPQRLCLEDCCV